MLTYHFISPSNPVNPENFLILGAKIRRKNVNSKFFAENFSSLQGLQQTLQTLQKLRLGTERVRRGYGAGPALNGKRQSFSNLFFYPSHQYCYRILLFFSCQLSSGRYMMPFEETSATAAACSMLGYKYWMSSHRRLLAVIGNHGRSKAFGNEILCMLTYGCQALCCNIFLIPFREVKTAAEC